MAISGAAARSEQKDQRAASVSGPVAARPLVCGLSGLTKSFGDDPPVLTGVELSIGHGDSIAVIGANGAGKSTMLRCILRLIEPDDGQIHLLGQDVVKLSAGSLRRLRAKVGFVFQHHNLVPRLSVLSNVLHGAQARFSGPRYWYQSLAPRAVREEAMECLDRVGLAHLARRRADQLSGGQSQRVAIARTLMQHAEFVIADEPVASLDPAAGLDVMRLFVELMREEGVTLLFTSHHLGQAIEFSERIVGLRDGKVGLDRLAANTQDSELSGLYG